jgi:hypothetical protein
MIQTFYIKCSTNSDLETGIMAALESGTWYFANDSRYKKALAEKMVIVWNKATLRIRLFLPGCLGGWAVSVLEMYGYVFWSGCFARF